MLVIRRSEAPRGCRLIEMLLLAALSLAAGADAQPRPGGGGIFRWGCDPEGGAPYVEADTADPGKVVGYEVDLAALIANRLGLEPQFVPVQFASIDASVRRGDFAIGLCGMEDSPARRGALSATIPYYAFREVITIRDADRGKYHTLANFSGRRVGTLGGSMAYEMLLKARTDLGVIPVSYDDDVHPYSDLALGRVDAVLLDHLIADRAMRREKGLYTIPEAVAVGYYVGVLAKDNAALRDRIDTILQAAMRDGSLEAIFRKWGLWNDDQPKLRSWVLAGHDVTTAAAGPSQPPGRTEAAPPPPEGRVEASPPSSPGGAAPLTGLPAVVRYLPSLLSAAVITIVLSCLSMALAVALGVVVASGRVYGGVLTRGLLTGYVELTRGTPVLLQLFVLYYGLAEFVRLPAFVAALVGLGLNYAAYESEIYRSALEAVPKGQLEAARVLGLSERQVFALVRGPQALRLALAPMTNDFVALLKDSSLVSVLTVVELTKQTSIFAANIGSWVIPGALCAAMYLGMSLPLSRVARNLEAKWKAPTA